jgi:hypothetical protein
LSYATALSPNALRHRSCRSIWVSTRAPADRLTRSLAAESANVTIPPWIRRRDSGQTRRPPRVLAEAPRLLSRRPRTLRATATTWRYTE